MWLLWWRYLTASPRKGIRWLVYLGLISMGISAWAWVAVTAVFDGFSQFLGEVFQEVDPHLRLEGPNLDDTLAWRIAAWPEVRAVTGVYERIGSMRHGERQVLVRVRGVRADFGEVSNLASHIVAGEGFPLEPGQVLMGTGIANRLALFDPARQHPVWLYLLSSVRGLAGLSEEALYRKRVMVKGLFSVQASYDNTWVLVPAESVPLWQGKPYDVLELRLWSERHILAIKRRLERQLGSAYQVQDPKAQHADVYRVLAQEKLLAMWGLGVLLMLAGGGILSVLSALVYYHRRDWALYRALGATPSWQQRLVWLLSMGFLALGMGLGALAGTLTVLSQDRWHWLKLRGGEGFLIQYFPVKLVWTDYLWLVGLLLVVGLGLYVYLRRGLARLPIGLILRGD